MKTITENNKLIAEFMGKKELITESQFLAMEHKAHNPTIVEYLKYNSDWNWLIEVVEKIESLGYWAEILGGLQNICLIGSINSSCESFKVVAETKIEAVYNTCINFIDWYNSAQEKN